MRDRAWFEAKRADLTRQLDQARANFNALEGALQFCEQAITDCLAEESRTASTTLKAVSPTVTAMPAMASIGD